MYSDMSLNPRDTARKQSFDERSSSKDVIFKVHLKFPRIEWVMDAVLPYDTRTPNRGAVGRTTTRLIGGDLLAGEEGFLPVDLDLFYDSIGLGVFLFSAEESHGRVV